MRRRNLFPLIAAASLIPLILSGCEVETIARISPELDNVDLRVVSTVSKEEAAAYLSMEESEDFDCEVLNDESSSFDLKWVQSKKRDECISNLGPMTIEFGDGGEVINNEDLMGLLSLREDQGEYMFTLNSEVLQDISNQGFNSTLYITFPGKILSYENPESMNDTLISVTRINDQDSWIQWDLTDYNAVSDPGEFVIVGMKDDEYVSARGTSRDAFSLNILNQHGLSDEFEEDEPESFSTQSGESLFEGGFSIEMNSDLLTTIGKVFLGFAGLNVLILALIFSVGRLRQR